jgi:hypothetical protein
LDQTQNWNRRHKNENQNRNEKSNYTDAQCCNEENRAVFQKKLPAKLCAQQADGAIIPAGCHECQQPAEQPDREEQL